MPSFESDFAILRCLCENFLRPGQLQRYTSQKSLTQQLPASQQLNLQEIHRDSVSAVSLASKQHLRSSGGTRTQRSENSIEVFAEHRMVADLQTRCIHLGRCGRLMACRLKFGTSFISFIWNFEEQLHASKLQRPPGLCRIGMAIWVLHCWSLLHVNE